MTVENGISVQLIPILQDNYVPVLLDNASKKAAVVDPGVAEPILEFLKDNFFELTHIFLTHHHGDHIGGVGALLKETNAQIVGASYDAHRLPALNQQVVDGEVLHWQGLRLEVLLLAGHTTGHIAYYCAQKEWLFCGDVLFLMGCGRLFEGTFEQMYNSLQRIKNLPVNTQIFCAHEYTKKNGEFALTVMPDNAALQARMKQVEECYKKSIPTVPAFLHEELATNPFLRCSLEEFRELREKRNDF